MSTFTKYYDKPGDKFVRGFKMGLGFHDIMDSPCRVRFSFFSVHYVKVPTVNI